MHELHCYGYVPYLSESIANWPNFINDWTPPVKSNHGKTATLRKHVHYVCHFVTEERLTGLTWTTPSTFPPITHRHTGDMNFKIKIASVAVKGLNCCLYLFMSPCECNFASCPMHTKITTPLHSDQRGLENGLPSQTPLYSNAVFGFH